MPNVDQTAGAAPSSCVVGLGQLAVSAGPDGRFASFALGSSLAVAIYDPASRTGGLLHAFLPSGQDPRLRIRAQRQPSLFVDAGVAQLVEGIQAAAASPPEELVAKIAGAAALSGHDAVLGDVGPANVEAAREILRRLGVRLVAEDVGGHRVRSVTLELASGVLRIHTHGEGEVLL